MSILSNIQTFGSNIVSGFGEMFVPQPGDTNFVGALRTPTTSGSASLTTNITSNLKGLINSVFSSLGRKINPPPKTATSPITPKVITFLSGTGDNKNSILGLNTMGIIVVGGLIGFLFFMRKR